MRRGPTLNTLQRQCDEFNARVKLGDEVQYEELIGEGGATYRTRTPAQILSGHTAVVWLEGKSGCVAIDHCKSVGMTPKQRVLQKYPKAFCETNGHYFQIVTVGPYAKATVLGVALRSRRAAWDDAARKITKS